MKGVVLCLTLFYLYGCAQPSCLNKKEVFPPRYVSFNGRVLNLVVGQSERVTHRLVTQVFEIFLKEVLGYPNATFLKPSKVFAHGNLDNFEIIDAREPPKYMVDLELWLPGSMDVSSHIHYGRDCGVIGPPGRYGWFISKSSSPGFNESNCMDHWRIFKNLRTSQIFHHDPKRILNRVYSDDFCKGSSCYNRVFTPDRCKNHEKCATLIAGNPESTSFVVNHINKMGWYVEVVWVGESLGSLIESPIGDGNPLLFLDYAPSQRVLLDDSQYTLIAFPTCEAFNDPDCQYEPHRLTKFAWSHLAKGATTLFKSLQMMTFTNEDYKELLSEYKRQMQSYGLGQTEAIRKSACDWMKRHENPIAHEMTTWQHWLPKDGEDAEIIIGGIFPFKKNRFSATGIVIAASMAVDEINAMKLLKHYKLHLLVSDGECKSDIVMKTFIDYILHNYNNLVGILGPACSDTVEPVAGISKHYRTLVISYSAEGSSFDRENYPYFFRTIGENIQYKWVYLELMRKFNWRQVAALTEDGTKYTAYISHTQVLLKNNSIAFSTNRKFPQDWNLETMNSFISDLKAQNTRIIIADVEEEAARAMMCLAFKLGMTAFNGWVWFLPPWLSPEWYNTTVHNTTRRGVLNCTTEQLMKAIEGHLSLSHTFFAPNNTVIEGNTTVGEWHEKYKAASDRINKSISSYGGFAYDAIWTYAYALEKLIRYNSSFASNLHSKEATKKLVDIIQYQTDFIGVTGRINFGSGSSRHTTVNVFQWRNNQSVIVGTFYPNDGGSENSSSGGHLEILKDKLKWYQDDQVPWDGIPPTSKCLVSGVAELFNLDCEVAIITTNIIVFSLIGLILLVNFLIFKHRYEKKVELTQKYMRSLGIDLLSPSRLEGLDKWEIPRDRVVINRKLGEGAFGTVYGGEAHFPDKGWVAVAVKTLKVGSTTEEKLDFLSEAEVMKRFDHKNVVRLLGVCTKNEPVYTVMEFMLYGDLKTFLLARRHLVNEKNGEESDEVSSKKLTSMALDVARALSYLAELKYVHRDVASRNCLVNATRIVKLGDFGMARPMCENDYYKFNRKGMLPVRWMAPESLALGVFSTSSDVWSYGVLLYEIITFGSFPFQGLSNNQVLEHVKAGNTINIPNGVKPQLEALIKSCWALDYKRRPPASELVEFIANNPRLLSACLDAPLSSVQIEDTGQLEIQISQPRKFSLGLRNRSSSTLGGGVGGGVGDGVGGGGWADISSQPLLPPPPQSPSHHPPLIQLRDHSTSEPISYQEDSLL